MGVFINYYFYNVITPASRRFVESAELFRLDSAKVLHNVVHLLIINIACHTAYTMF